MKEPLQIIDFDPAILSGVARSSLGLPGFTISDWSVSALRHEKVIETTGGLYRFSGKGRDGSQEREWSAILKVILRPETGCAEPQELCYWRRELLAYRDGLLASLPGAVRAPRCSGVSEHPEGAWIWLEDIRETAGPDWTLADFERAARHLGRFAGAFLAGRPLPQAPWLCGSLFRSFYADGDWWARFIDPASPNNAWQRPVVQAVYSNPLQAGVLQIWARKWEWIAANERLPRVFCHNDAHRRNLMLREDVVQAVRALLDRERGSRESSRSCLPGLPTQPLLKRTPVESGAPYETKPGASWPA